MRETKTVEEDPVPQEKVEDDEEIEEKQDRNTSKVGAAAVECSKLPLPNRIESVETQLSTIIEATLKGFSTSIAGFPSSYVSIFIQVNNHYNLPLISSA